jgi:DNA polymerase-3 subunit epsilon
MRKIVLDTETTGLDPKQGHRIIELAAIELEGRKVSLRRFHRYLNPEREIEAGAVAVHGLTYERLQNEVRGYREQLSGIYRGRGTDYS